MVAAQQFPDVMALTARSTFTGCRIRVRPMGGRPVCRAVEVPGWRDRERALETRRTDRARWAREWAGLAGPRAPGEA